MTTEQLEKLLSDDPFDLELRLQLAKSYLNHKAFEKAQKQVQIILKQDPSHKDAESLAENIQQLSQEMSNGEPQSAPIRLIKEENPIAPLKSIFEAREKQQQVRFSDIAGMSALKRTIRLKVIEPFRNPSLFQRFKKNSNDGILLYGPPGCGKTMLAKAIASECDIEFISVDISDVLDMWIGNSEKNLANVFERARASKGCVLFFDELDAIAISRSKVQSHHARTLVNELLTQMDGLGKDNNGILVLGATNMPWDIDPAAKRPGRFSRQIFVPPLDEEARIELLRLKLHGIPHQGDINLKQLGQETKDFSGADISGLIEIAKEHVLSDIIDSNVERDLNEEDLISASQEVHPSCEEWLKTAENLVKYGGVGSGYKDLASYLKK